MRGQEAEMRGFRADVAFDGERLRRDGALVLVEGSKIIAVQSGSAAAPAGCDVAYVPGTTLLPGLIDTHTHLCGDAGPAALDQLPDLSVDALDGIIAAAMTAQLAAGVTAVRDLGDHRWAVLDRARDLGHGPTVLAAGPPLTSYAGHCAAMGGEVAGPDGLRRAVRERAERGADVVKIMASGGAMTVGTDMLACQFTLAELRGVVAEAHRLGLPVVAHAHGLPAVQQCADAEVDGIEHCSCLTELGFSTPPALTEQLAAAGTFVGPTLGRIQGTAPPPQIQAMMERTGITWERRLEQVTDLYRGGVTLISGADSGISPGKPHGILREAVIDLAGCGVPNEVALTSATGLAAAACGLRARTGRLAAGLDADLLVVDGDPGRDITALRNIRAVVSRGREVTRTAAAAQVMPISSCS